MITRTTPHALNLMSALALSLELYQSALIREYDPTALKMDSFDRADLRGKRADVDRLAAELATLSGQDPRILAIGSLLERGLADIPSALTRNSQVPMTNVQPLSVVVRSLQQVVTESLRENATPLRELAARADRIPLSDEARAVYELLCRHPPEKGFTAKDIVNALSTMPNPMNITEDRMKQNIRKELLPCGIENLGRGYFIPQDKRLQSGD